MDADPPEDMNLRARLDSLLGRGRARIRPPAPSRTPSEADTKVYRVHPGPSAKGPRLRVRSGPATLAGREYVLDKPVATVGRRPDLDIVLPDPSVSRAHLRFRWVGDRVTVVDLGSTNGTFVNGRRVGPREVALRPGDQVRVGRVLLEYRDRP